jgi:hypothetical protein
VYPVARTRAATRVGQVGRSTYGGAKLIKLTQKFKKFIIFLGGGGRNSVAFPGAENLSYGSAQNHQKYEGRALIGEIQCLVCGNTTTVPKLRNK